MDRRLINQNDDHELLMAPMPMAFEWIMGCEVYLAHPTERYMACDHEKFIRVLDVQAQSD